MFAWLSLVLYKANEALRKQVALKADYSRLHCISLAGMLTCHVPIVLLCLRSERLWQRFALRDPSPVPVVRQSLMKSVAPSHCYFEAFKHNCCCSCLSSLFVSLAVLDIALLGDNCGSSGQAHGHGH